MSFDNSTEVHDLIAVIHSLFGRPCIAEGQVQSGRDFLIALACLNCFINSSLVGLKHWRHLQCLKQLNC